MILRIWIILLMSHSVVGWQRQCKEDEMFCSVGLCSTQECTQCNPHNAVCQTQSIIEPIPSKLPNTTRYLLLYYEGLPTVLTSSMLAPYSMLVNITLYGNFIAIAPATFQDHKHLTFLTLKHTQISSLPSDLFSDSSLLHHLNLPNNKLTAIPENVFHSISRVSIIDLSFNPIDICSSTSIGERFAWLSRLESVSLAGLGSFPFQNCSLNTDYLKPLVRVNSLDLSESHIVQKNHMILTPLHHLSELSINYLEPYNTCPSLANGLFRNLPPNITTIHAEGWKTNGTMLKSCALNKTSFEPLRGSQLTWLSFRYSDKILGDRLTSQTFAGINLKILDLTWCRLSAFDKDAFDALQHLTFLSLEGNQLGPRELRFFFTPGSGLKLNSLTLESIGAFSDDRLVYSLGNVLEHSPNIKILILNGNFMAKLPRFSSPQSQFHIESPMPYQVIKLGLDDNCLSDLSVNATLEMCTLMPNLTFFSAQNNLLKDITGLCPNISEIMLAYNKIGTHEDRNLRAVRRLVHLIRLDLRWNGIRNLPYDLVLSMINLENFFMTGNEIQYIPANFFSNSVRLSFIDLSSNLLTSIDLSMFNSSDKLSRIYLQSNLLTKIPSDITRQLDILTRNGSHLLWIFDIADNPFDCSCENEYFQGWVRYSAVVANVRQLTCSEVNELSRVGNFVYNYTRSAFYCTWKTPISIGGSVLLAIVLSLSIGICVYKNKWYVTHLRVVIRAMKMGAKQIKMEQQCRYDAFVSYDVKNDADSLWVMHHLIPEIEGKTIQEACGYESAEQLDEDAFKLYIHERDSDIGTQKYTELCNAVEDSRKLIILLSNSYLASSACLNEANLLAGYETDKAQCYHPNRILILVLEELDEEIIRPPITGLLQLNVIDVIPGTRDNARKMRAVWNRIRKFISRPNVIYKKLRSKKRRDNQNGYQQID